jgi:hypothetical protein
MGSESTSQTPGSAARVKMSMDALAIARTGSSSAEIYRPYVILIIIVPIRLYNAFQ